MPITLLDILLLVVMLVSGLLAMIRGFMREILSIGAWGIAALVTLYTFARALPIAQGYFSSNTVATGVTIGSIFLLTLLLVSIVTVRISDMILDSRVGALDRTLGFLFGLGRGVGLVGVAAGRICRAEGLGDVLHIDFGIVHRLPCMRVVFPVVMAFLGVVVAFSLLVLALGVMVLLLGRLQHLGTLGARRRSSLLR